MRIEFIKATRTKNGVFQVVGQKMTVRDDYGKQLINEGVAIDYTGAWPPKKTKIKLSKLK